jgi:hypothetical protein
MPETTRRPERVHPRWPADRATGIHSIQARLAFEPGADAYPARLITVVNGSVLVERVPQGTTAGLVVALPDRLARLLGRDDLTMLRGTPLVLVSEHHRVLGVATGPKDLPGQLRIGSNVSRLEGGEAVEIPEVDDGQPALQLLAAVPASG